jgi:signal transduction histidine kinase
MEITSDDGPGIEPENHAMVFQRYAQVKECSIVPRKGHGLGLAGANIISRCLGGSLELESEKGKGATFRLSRFRLRLKASPGHARRGRALNRRHTVVC